MKQQGLWKKALIPVLIVVLVLVIVVGLLIKMEYDKKLRQESYNQMYDQLTITYTTKEKPTLEVGEEWTYSTTNKAEFNTIPDQLRKYFKSVPSGSTIKVTDNGDLTLVGDKVLKVTVSKEDQYGQLVERSYDLPIYLDDTVEPEIDCTASEIVAKNEQDIRANVRTVVDKRFGLYTYSEMGENHTYKLDMKEVKWNEPGEYNVYIIINDNGKTVRHYFTVKIEDNTPQPEQSDPTEIIIVDPSETENSEEEIAGENVEGQDDQIDEATNG